SPKRAGRDNHYAGKTVSRPLRLDFDGAVHHVIARGNERRAIFRDAHDRQRYLDRLGIYAGRLAFVVHAYCLMPNHVHLAVRTGRVPLSRVMLALHGAYAQDFNRRHRRVGHLFQGRYKAFLVEAEEYLACLVRYIHLNPVRARLASTAAAYPWSSARAYSKGRGPLWLDMAAALSRFGPDRRRAVRAYEAFLSGSSGPRYEDVEARGALIKGGDDFVARIVRGSADWRCRVDVSADDVARCAAMVFRLRRDELRRAEWRVRGLTALAAREVARVPLCRTAGLFHKHETTIVKDVRRVEAQLERSPALRTEAALLRRALADSGLQR
ncbi:MAG TPA: transposase, partial [Thermoanaerobaculia bacterium]|nr:transposase [Thermoanaerobaculia bacterium]